jgi:hypothetical protein
MHQCKGVLVKHVKKKKKKTKVIVIKILFTLSKY